MVLWNTRAELIFGPTPKNFMSPDITPDQALRTIGTEGNFRILIASTTGTVRGVLNAQEPTDDERPMLADLVTASVLLRLTMSPDYRLQTIVQSPEAGRIVGDSHPDGVTRGLIQRQGDGAFKLGGGTQLSVHRTIFGGDTHQGVVATGEEQTLGDAVTGYLHQSEQITSVVNIGHRFDGDELAFAGGFVVQVIPEDGKPDQSSLALMTARLENLPNVVKVFDQCDGDNQQVADLLYGPIEFKSLETNEFHSGCICSPERVVRALDTLSDDDIEELTADGDNLEVDCDYCNTTHEISPQQIAR